PAPGRPPVAPPRPAGGRARPGFAPDRALLSRFLPGRPPGPAPEGEEELARMGFFEHLEEFRKRLIVSLIAIFVAFLVCWNWAPQIFEFLAAPVRKVLPPGQNLSYTTLTEPFLMYFRVALLAAVIAASPIILWQIWLFVAPALYRKEQKYVLPFILTGVAFFL